MSRARAIWEHLSSDGIRRGLLIGLALLELLALLIPQSPVPPDNASVYSQWLALLQQERGPIVHNLAALGLLTLRTSWWMRLLLAALTLVAARYLTDERHSPRRRHLFAVGVLLLVAGWGLCLYAGWQETGLIAWPDEPLRAPERGLTIAPPKDAPLIVLRPPYLLRREGMVWGVEARAVDVRGSALLLRTTSQGEPQPRVRLILDDAQREGYFALPEEALVFRLIAPPRDEAPALTAQLYNSGNGTLLTETTLAIGENRLFAGEARMMIECLRLPRYRLIDNPGLLPTLLGWAALLIAEGSRGGTEEDKGGRG